MNKCFYVFLIAICIAIISCTKSSSKDEPTQGPIIVNVDDDEDNQQTGGNGKLSGVFSVSSTKKVVFSKGNLQYNAMSNAWRFAPHQYDVIGSGNENVSPYYAGWIDLFGWATSGYNDKFPYMTSRHNADYGDGSRDIDGTSYDWGVYNAISNGGNKKGMWRTLTYYEWEYLVFNRKNADKLRGQATVNGVHGYVLLPDAWSEEIAFTPLADSWTKSIYSLNSWKNMERNGAVFLPCGGYRVGTSVDEVSVAGYYWSSTHSWADDAGEFFFCEKKQFPEHAHVCVIDGYRAECVSVRLVQNSR